MKRYSLIRETEAEKAAKAGVVDQAPPPPPPRDDNLTPGCADLCGLARDPEEVRAMGDDGAVALVAVSQMSIVIILMIQAALMITWMMFNVVPGFALFDGPPGAVSAYTHDGWWMAVDLLTWGWGIASLWFGLNYVPSQRLVERGVARNLSWLVIYMIVLGVNAIQHAVHLALSITEEAYCQSTLCTNNNGVLIAFIVILGFEAMLNLWAIKEANKYKTNLSNVLAIFDYVLMVKRDGEQPPPPPLPPATDAVKRYLSAAATTTTNTGVRISVPVPIQHKMR